MEIMLGLLFIDVFIMVEARKQIIEYSLDVSLEPVHWGMLELLKQSANNPADGKKWDRY